MPGRGPGGLPEARPLPEDLPGPVKSSGGQDCRAAGGRGIKYVINREGWLILLRQAGSPSSVRSGARASALLPGRPLAPEVTAPVTTGTAEGESAVRPPPAVSKSGAHGAFALLLFFWSLVCTTLRVVRKLPRKRTRNVMASTNTCHSLHSSWLESLKSVTAL